MRSVNTGLLLGLFLSAGICFAANPPSNSVTSQPEKSGMYVVKADDTLYSIAWQFGLDYRVIAALNHLHTPYQLAAGQQLVLVEPQHTAPAGLGNPPIVVKHLPGYSSQIDKQAVVTSAPTSQVAKAAPNTAWVWPTTGTVIKSYSANQNNGNKGIDITGKLGQPIVAAASGDVVYSGNGIPGYGNLILLKHNSDYLTAYAFNEKNQVKEGQIIKQGQEIALMGKGTAAKPELHFEIRYKGQPVNPGNYLPKR